MRTEEIVGGRNSRPPRPRARHRRSLTLQRRIRRRRLVAALLGLLALAVIAGSGVSLLTTPNEAAGGPVTLELAGQTIATLAPVQAQRVGKGDGKLPLGSFRQVERGTSRVTYRIDRPLLRQRMAVAKGGNVRVPAVPVASHVAAPIVKQAFPNNCETAALSMLLATRKADVDQRALQRQLPQAPPLDPSGAARGERIWGDPQEGFVGRAQGGGPAGGYGVYERPVMRLASHWARPLDLSGGSPEAIYDRLLSGHAVMVWIGLSDGPYETWRTPDGGLVRANFGEHTVVLTGVQGNQVLVNDPIDGRRKRWSKDGFEEMWNRLGRRAVSV